MIQHVAPFQAKWESMPPSLRPPVLTTAQKVCKVIWNIISVLIPIIGLVRLAAYGLGVLAKRVLLPAAYNDEHTFAYFDNLFTQKCEQRNVHFDVVHQKVMAPDGAALDATLFRHRGGNEQTPTTLYFGGNGMLKGMSEGWDWLLKDSIDQNKPMNLVVFHYRSVGNSTGQFSQAKDFVVDGYSLVQWVREVVKTPDPLIHFHGLSLGGAIALKTKASDEHLNGNLLHERSFSSIEDVIRVHAAHVHWLLKPLVPLLIWVLKNQELELDAASDWNRLKGRKLVIYHPKDPVIPYPASLARKVHKDDTFELKQRFYINNHHCAPLEHYHAAQEMVSGFVFA